MNETYEKDVNGLAVCTTMIGTVTYTRNAIKEQMTSLQEQLNYWQSLSDKCDELGIVNEVLTPELSSENPISPVSEKI